MRDSTAQQKGDALWLWTKTTEIEKGWHKGEDEGMFDCISLEGWEVYMLTNIDPTPAEGNFCGDNNHPVKPHIMEKYNRHMDYVSSSDRMANSYSMSPHTFKWTTKLFFYLLDLTVLNCWIFMWG